MSDDLLWDVECGDGATGLLGFGEVDLVFADVPYAAEVDERNEAETLRDNPFDFAPMTPELMERLAQAISAKCRRWALIMTSDFEVHLWRDALTRAGMDVLRIGHWVRMGTKPQMTGDRPAQGTEPIVIAHSRVGERWWNGGGKAAVWPAPIVRGEQKLHPTHKPPGLLRQLIEDFSNQGERWCDPTFGSCELGVCAVGSGRRFVGWELQEQYVQLARQRLKIPLFDRSPLQADMFRPSTSSRAATVRAELDHAILRVLPSDGLVRSDLLQSTGVTKGELSRALSRLRKAKLVRCDGNTKAARYFRILRHSDESEMSTGDAQ